MEPNPADIGWRQGPPSLQKYKLVEWKQIAGCSTENEKKNEIPLKKEQSNLLESTLRFVPEPKMILFP